MNGFLFDFLCIFCFEIPFFYLLFSFGSSTSESFDMRQRPSRYSIRAGRNLPDKEFRYLRTVIVTAAIDRGFGSQLITGPLDLPASGRSHPLYVLFRVSRELCFW